MATTSVIIPRDRIERYIFLLRGQKIMLSTQVADLYRVENSGRRFKPSGGTWNALQRISCFS
jgi:hypothetical protein